MRKYILLILIAGLWCWHAAEVLAGERLVLAPGKRLELSTTVADDTLRFAFTIAVPDSFKHERHLCRLRANGRFELEPPPNYRWAVTDSSVTVLSALDLIIKLGPNTKLPFRIDFDFINLDRPQRRSGSAMLVIGGEHHAATNPPSSFKNDPAVVPPEEQAGESTTLSQSNWSLWLLTSIVIIAFVVMILMRIFSRVSSPSYHENRKKPVITKSKTAESSFAALESKIQSPAATTTAGQDDEEVEIELVPLADTSSTTISAPSVDESLLATAELHSDEKVAMAESNVAAMLSQLRQATEAAQAVLKTHDQAGNRHSPKAVGASRPAEDDTPPATIDAEPANGQRQEEPSSNIAARGEVRPERIRWEILPMAEGGAKLEEISAAIDGLVAAASSKPLTAPAVKIAEKLAQLQRASTCLQQLTELCRGQNWETQVSSVETTKSKVDELAFSYRNWTLDHTLKLTLSLSQQLPEKREKRQEVIDGLLNTLYETRKLAVQGPIYFERKVTQLFGYELPRLREQFKGIANAELESLWQELLQSEQTVALE